MTLESDGVRKVSFDESSAARELRGPLTVRVLDADGQKVLQQQSLRVEILAPHEHSYLALSHLGVFTDTMNLFQDLAVPQRFESILIPDQKIRRSWKTYLMRTSMSLGVVWMSLALVSTPWTLFRALRNLVENKLQPEDSVAFLGSAYFLLIFLLIPFVYAGALFGYWTPRLILPALLYFFLSAFLLIDRKIVKQRHSGQIAAAVLAIVIGQCAIEAVMLA